MEERMITFEKAKCEDSDKLIEVQIRTFDDDTRKLTGEPFVIISTYFTSPLFVHKLHSYTVCFLIRYKY